jgi:hypothetical protein
VGQHGGLCVSAVIFERCRPPRPAMVSIAVSLFMLSHAASQASKLAGFLAGIQMLVEVLHAGQIHVVEAHADELVAVVARLLVPQSDGVSGFVDRGQIRTLVAQVHLLPAADPARRITAC